MFTPNYLYCIKCVYSTVLEVRLFFKTQLFSEKHSQVRSALKSEFLRRDFTVLRTRSVVPIINEAKHLNNNNQKKILLVV